MTETTPATPAAQPTRRRVAADLTAAPTVTPYLCVDGAAAAIDFYVDAFGAVEHHRMVGDDGRIGHAEIVIGNSRIMLADEYPEAGVLAPTTRGGSSTNFNFATPDAATLDAIFTRALELGATELRPVADQFYGHRQQIVAGATTLQVKLTSKFGTRAAREQLVTLRLKSGRDVVLVGEFEVGAD